MKNILLLASFLLSHLLVGQVFNRSKAGMLDAIPFQLNNSLYTISSTSIDEIGNNGEILLSTPLPFLNGYRDYKTVLKKSNGNFLIVGSSQTACDVASNRAYFAYEYSPQLVLIDSTHQSLNSLGGVMQVLELNQGRYFVLSPSGYLVLNNQLDTIATKYTFSLAQIEQALYLGGDKILIYSKTWASSTPMYTILDLSTEVITPWANSKGGEIMSLNDSVFACLNLQTGDLFRYKKNDRTYLDSNRLSLSASLTVNSFQELTDGFVLRGDSGLTVFNKSNLSLRGTYLAKTPLIGGSLSVDGDQLFFYRQNIYGEVTNYHVLEGAKLNQAPSNIVEGLILSAKNTSLKSIPHPSGAPNLYQVEATWDISMLNNSAESIDSVRVLWADVNATPFCNSIYFTLPVSVNGLAPGDSTSTAFSMTFQSVYAPSGTGYLNFIAALVMANGKVVSEEGQAVASISLNNINLAEANLLVDIKLYPNPASHSIYIDAQEEIDQVELINLQGQVIRTYNSQDTLKKVSVEGLAKGIYWLKLKSDSKQCSRKILVN